MSPRQLLKHRFVRNVATVASGTAAAQAITLTFTPVITRLYGPELFGLQSVFASLVGLVSAAAALGFQVAIMVPEYHSEARGLARLAIGSAAVISVLIAALLGASGEWVLQVLNAEAIAGFIYLIPFAVLATVASSVAGYWLTRMQAFSISARSAVLTSLLVNTAKAGGGVLAPSANVLIATNTLGPVLGASLAYWGWRRSLTQDAMDRFAAGPAPAAFDLARRFRDFPLFQAPQSLLNSASHVLPVLMLASYVGAEAAGQYALAAAVLGAPVLLVGGAISSVFLPRINQAIRAGEDARRLILRATGAMAALGAVPLLVVIATGPVLFEFVFGEGWHKAGVYAAWLSPWLFCQFINRPSVAATPPLKLQRGLLVYEIFSSGTKVLAIWLGLTLFNSDIAAVALFSIFGALAYLWLIVWIVRRSRRTLPTATHR